MAHIYENPDGTGLMIYTVKHSILLSRKTGKRFSTPVPLAQDYMQDLSHIFWNQTIYFCYINVKQELVLYHIHNQTPLLCITATMPETIQTPHVSVVGDTLCLFYLRHHETEGTYTMETTFPLSNSIPICSSQQKQWEDEQYHSQQTIAKQSQEIAHLKEQLKSASAQYEELMQVANRYREEAQKWHDHFLKRTNR